MANTDNILRKTVKKWGDSNGIIINREESVRFGIEIGDDIILDLLKVIKAGEDEKGGMHHEIKTKNR